MILLCGEFQGCAAWKEEVVAAAVGAAVAEAGYAGGECIVKVRAYDHRDGGWAFPSVVDARASHDQTPAPQHVSSAAVDAAAGGGASVGGVAGHKPALPQSEAAAPSSSTASERDIDAAAAPMPCRSCPIGLICPGTLRPSCP